MKREIPFLVLLLGLFAGSMYSCTGSGDERFAADVAKVDVTPVKIRRYGKALFSVNRDSLKQELKKLAKAFPVFLQADLDDTLNIISIDEFISDPLNIELYRAVLTEYPDLDGYNRQFTDAFKHFKYFFPDAEIPAVYTYVSGLMYEMPVQFFGNNMIIALDMYLGKDFKPYRKTGLPLYRIKRMDRHYIVRDGIYELYYYHFLEKPGKNVLERMIEKGKHLYFLDIILPETADSVKIGYTQNQLVWCRKNEKNIWAFMIDNELLYASGSETMRKFFTDGPFTHEFSRQAPARIGEWTGWQIVRSYMLKNPSVTPAQLFANDDAQAILMKSSYRPR